MRKLGMGILSVRYVKSRVQLPNLKETLLTPNQKKLVQQILDGNFDKSLYAKLDKHEQLLIRKVLHHFNSNIDVGDDDTLYERWEVVKTY